MKIAGRDFHAFPDHHINLWERACSRRRRHIPQLHCLTHRIREQARSYSFDRILSGRTRSPVGVSLLAIAVGQNKII
jgi:hypothetical protein